jgi:hypothetical protein
MNIACPSKMIKLERERFSLMLLGRMARLAGPIRMGLHDCPFPIA